MRSVQGDHFLAIDNDGVTGNMDIAVLVDRNAAFGITDVDPRFGGLDSDGSLGTEHAGFFHCHLSCPDAANFRTDDFLMTIFAHGNHLIVADTFCVVMHHTG
ncbi:hypothetical protein Xedl_03837 [Xenorhabdus eapokensis]|uniref:Uncharacterized protein n=1 Tax=Xenorhabdus eapokensis TaxID=1873482 RepID=A0A1Q5TEC9_9GAMM|nr:hypothetical protein Xedl_03837 [Xenorhabdus eapokensis]